MDKDNNKYQSTTSSLFGRFNIARLVKLTNLAEKYIAILLFLMSVGALAHQGTGKLELNQVANQLADSEAPPSTNNDIELSLANFIVLITALVLFVYCFCCLNKCRKYFDREEHDIKLFDDNQIALSVITPTETTPLFNNKETSSGITLATNTTFGSIADSSVSISDKQDLNIHVVKNLKF